MILNIMKRKLHILKNDPWLEPFRAAIEGRHEDALRKEKELVGDESTLNDFANGHHFFGLHREDNGWVFREWAPNATAIFMLGTFNDWTESDAFELKRKDNDVWEVKLPADAIIHGDLYKLHVYWDGGDGERIPAYANRVVQDEKSYIFSAQVWAPEQPYVFKNNDFKPDTTPLLIYECHIGMGQNKEDVGTYVEYREYVLPRVKADG